MNPNTKITKKYCTVLCLLIVPHKWRLPTSFLRAAISKSATVLEIKIKLTFDHFVTIDIIIMFAMIISLSAAAISSSSSSSPKSPSLSQVIQHF